MPSTKKPFSFDEFYRAFGKSVPADVTFENGEIQIVRVEPASLASKGKPVRSRASAATTMGTAQANESVGDSDVNGRSSVLDAPLPAHIAALAELQEPDGSWKYSKELEFVLNGVAPPPPESISGKLWATAICVNVWRQSPECFVQLEASYDKAMLHCDDDVLHRVKLHVDFESVDNIRKYNNEEAKRIRELLAKEAAAKRALEDEEDRRVAREREEIEQITEFSLDEARRLPLKTQSHFVKGLRSEVTSVGEEGKSVHLQFLDGDQERERKVALCFLRRREEDDRAIRVAEFDRLRATWREPIVCADEVARLEEIRAKKKRPEPWNSSSSEPLLSLPSIASSPAGAAKDPMQQQRRQTRKLTFSAQNRSAAIMRASVASVASDPQQDALYQIALSALLAYDKAYAHARESVKSCARKYTTAILYKERFHAFDGFRDALAALMHTAIVALERIAEWKKCAKKKNVKGKAPIFVWNGQNFVLALSRSLDFLICHRELIEWYGDEFPLELNPFMLSRSLADKAEDMGLQLATSSVGTVYSLHAALRLRKKSPDEESAAMPTWWPESQYSDELLARIAVAESIVIQEMRASGLLVQVRAAD